MTQPALPYTLIIVQWNGEFGFLAERNVDRKRQADTDTHSERFKG